MLTLYLLFGCGAAEVELLDHGLWVTDGCTSNAATFDDGILEIDTSACSPARVHQVLSEPIKEGDTLEIVWWHDFLFAEQPALGFFRLYVDDALIYETERPIPGPPNAVTESFMSSAPGATLTVEISNHGSNTWSLLRLTRL